MLSVVIPVYNEEEVIEVFYKELSKHLPKRDTEMIFVDDGSIDNTPSLLKKLAEENSNIRIFSFRKHRGKSEALTLGFKKASGDMILTIDADLQDRPDQIGKLIEKSKEGWDLISGWRKNRKDSFFKKISSKVFNLISSIFWGLKVNDLNSGLKLYTKDAAKSLNLYGGMHRFIPLLLFQEGFSVTEVPVIHDKRRLGKSKYNISKVFTEMPDLFTMLFLMKYAKRPLHFFGVFGGILFILGFIILAYLSYLRFLGERIGDRPLLLFGVLLVLTGLQVFFIGFIADLILHLSKKDDIDSKLK
ncbi:glycosyl transferase [Candidatus Roizmanbacteria bacterium RIFCSPHIGHO2_12_FULL_33_9]|uniref:Glycosyl transferase n=1 Tax=Candidatus Roizmanbacteria bacterium RIFCSPHIGHO2_12_FULL_33_9 TaxID=1802045 RepID=A0A1F7HJ34_9BACT|nr:MAG: glycosyl transferase [Candidatus Roizmanbacteria bacterium RIFCSPHIGHO2_12_FULL_33_9]